MAPGIVDEVAVLSVADTGQGAAIAIAQLIALPAFVSIRVSGYAAWLAEYEDETAGDADGPIQAAAHAVVDPMIARICEYARTNGLALIVRPAEAHFSEAAARRVRVVHPARVQSAHPVRIIRIVHPVLTITVRPVRIIRIVHPVHIITVRPVRITRIVHPVHIIRTVRPVRSIRIVHPVHIITVRPVRITQG